MLPIPKKKRQNIKFNFKLINKQNIFGVFQIFRDKKIIRKYFILNIEKY